MEIKKRIAMLVIALSFISGIVCYHGAAFAEHTGPGRYNNEDLKKFEAPENTVEKTAPISSDKKALTAGEIAEREDWCRKGTPLIRTISEAKKEIDDVLARYPEKRGEDIDKMVLPDGVQQDRLDINKRNLRAAEAALSDLEQQAYRQGVPIGWVRCDFE